MATAARMGTLRRILLAATALAPVVSGRATTSVEDEAPAYQSDVALELEVVTPEDDQGLSSLLPMYIVMPLTESLGINQSEVVGASIHIEGNIMVANGSNYRDIDNNTIAYLSCDPLDEDASDDEMAPDDVLNNLMDKEVKPRAIVLFSVEKNFCGVWGEFDYRSVLTMTDLGDAQQAEMRLEALPANEMAQGTISGNTTDEDPEFTGGSGQNSAVAMSVLYSVTGLVTLLFLVIILTGAIKAHRNPDRYGPQSGLGGRPRQSRAKGLARAVLETLPIVKFRGGPSSNADLEYKLETLSREESARDPAGSRDGYSLRQQQQQQQQQQLQPPPLTVPEPEARASGLDGGDSDFESGDENLGCSICTDDFTVGEDVRVLPCSHKFHPGCIDPWLVNVSGTCPLCRLDLRMEGSSGRVGSANDNASLPPPIDFDGADNDNDGTSSTGTGAGERRKRLSRFFDMGALRNAAKHEERMEALRRMNVERRAGAGAEARPAAESGQEEASRRTRVTNKLRDKFRIRTRAQAARGTPAA